MRVPPFFRRLFKFTSMDFETVCLAVSILGDDERAKTTQAVWEMTHLIIAPKKVFRNIYYHVCTPAHISPPQDSEPSLTNPSRNVPPPLAIQRPSPTTDLVIPLYRNQKLLPPPRPSLHLPPRPLLPPRRPRLGNRLRAQHPRHSPHHRRVRPCPFSRRLAARRDGHVFPRGTRAGPAAATRLVRAAGRCCRGCGGGGAGVWVLL